MGRTLPDRCPSKHLGFTAIRCRPERWGVLSEGPGGASAATGSPGSARIRAAQNEPSVQTPPPPEDRPVARHGT